MPSNIKISKDEIRSFKELQIISQLRSVKDKIGLFMKKYTAEFVSFERGVNDQEEDFEIWDDYIEWKAYEREKIALEKELEEVRNAENFTITD